LTFWLLALVIFAIDLFSKKWLINFLSFGESIPLINNFYGIDFSLTLVANRGAAWGIFSEYPYLLISGRILIIALICLWILQRKASFENLVPFGLILGGAVGNVVDFFIHGAVLDFLAFNLWGYPFPVFNLADSAIFCGAILSLFPLLVKWFHAKNQHSAR